MPQDWIDDRLADLQRRNLFRSLRAVESGAGARVAAGGRRLVNFSSNNYLDLAGHPALAAAVAAAAERWGWGAGASLFVSGYTALHEELRLALAVFERAEDAVLFPTGYQANLGALTALAEKTDTVILDKLCHASIVDGARLCGARVRVYPHGDLGKLERLLESEPGRKLVATDTVFSMDGDLAPLPELVRLCDRRGALLLADEAHATGLLGENGAGALEWFENCGCGGLHDFSGLVRVGTLSKALGGIGGFVAAGAKVCDLVRNRARSCIYTTGLPPAAAAAALCALRLVREEPWRREKALALSENLRGRLRDAGLTVSGGPSAIVPVSVVGDGQALALAENLREAGFLCPAIRPPTVPRGGSRLRVSLTAGHDEAETEALFQALLRAGVANRI